jgi:hypothetical protein
MSLVSDTGVGVGGPERRTGEVPGTKVANSVMEGACGERGIGRPGTFVGQPAVEVDREFHGGPVTDWPQRADDALVARQIEGSGEVHRLIG